MNSKNHAPISIRIIHHRQTRYIATRISVTPHQWDERRSVVKSNHGYAEQLNAFLAKRLHDVKTLTFEALAKNASVSADDIKNMFLGKNRKDFFAIAHELISRSEAKGAIGTHDKNLSVIKKLHEYVGADILPFAQLSPAFIRKYELYLRQVLHNSTNTISSNLKFIRRVFNEAYQQGIITYETNPFLKLTVSTEPTTRSYLSEEELERIEKLQYDPSSVIELSRLMFVWATYSAGIRISDILLLTWDNFNGTHISFTARKTKRQHAVKLPAKSIAILEKLKSKGPSRFVFPFIHEGLDISNGRAVDLEISRATARYNKHLRTIGSDASITKKISSHTARHTFATRALQKGMRLDTVQKHLQHKNTAVTQIYAQISNIDLDKSMDVFNDH